MPVHLYGHPADMDALMTLAAEHKLTVVEDAAQAHGAKVGSRHAGSFGAFGCFSFYPTKNLGACGEGGLIVTNDAGHARTLRMLRDWGQEEKGRHDIRGYNSRLHAVQAAILRVKLRHLDTWNAQRRRHAEAYGHRLERIGIVTPHGSEGHAPCMALLHDPRAEARHGSSGARGPGHSHRRALPAAGAPAARLPRSRLPARRVSRGRTGGEGGSLSPLHPALTDEDRERVCDVLEKVLDSVQ